MPKLEIIIKIKASCSKILRIKATPEMNMKIPKKKEAWEFRYVDKLRVIAEIKTKLL